MIEPAAFEVVTDNVRVFGRTRLPKGEYPGAVEWIVMKLRGHTIRDMARAVVNVDRKVLEQLDEQIVPNLASVDFDLLPYVKSGDIRIVN